MRTSSAISHGNPNKSVGALAHSHLGVLGFNRRRHHRRRVFVSKSRLFLAMVTRPVSAPAFRAQSPTHCGRLIRPASGVLGSRMAHRVGQVKDASAMIPHREHRSRGVFNDLLEHAKEAAL